MPKDDQSELFWLVDELDNELGSVPRSIANSNPKLIHRAVDIILLNPVSQILLQRRSQTKDTNPGKWTLSATGHVTYSQSYDEAARRELEEELGLVLDLEFIGKYISYMENETEYTAIFKGVTDITPQNFDREEVSEVIWVDLDLLPQFTRTQPFSLSSIESVKKANLWRII